MSVTQTIRSDTRTLWHLLMAPVRGTTHQDRLESFYAGQAGNYDAFRSRLLHGRQAMIDRLSVRPGQVWVDLGCGTGENMERFGTRAADLSAAHLVDLSPSLLQVARQRIDERGGERSPDRFHLHHADATQFELPRDPQRPDQAPLADLVTLSYSLTMIPDWFAAIDRAFDLLRPGGQIGIVDFFVSRKYVEPDDARHGWSTRAIWPLWFAMDNVFLSPDHLPMLRRRFQTVSLSTHRGRVPYLPLVSVPYYVFIGTKPLAGQPSTSTSGSPMD